MQTFIYANTFNLNKNKIVFKNTFDDCGHFLRNRLIIKDYFSIFEIKIKMPASHQMNKKQLV